MSLTHFVVCKTVASLAICSALTALSPAHADFFQRDDGAQGIVLTNLPASGGTRVLLETRHAPIQLTTRSTPALRPSLRRKALAPLVAAAAIKHDLPEELLLAVIEAESNFNPQAVSIKGAQGLMQIMPRTARDLGVVDAFDPEANIDGGARYLKAMLARFGNNLPLALAAYNAGPTAVQRSGTIPPYAETRRYVSGILSRYHGLTSVSTATPP